LGNNILAEVPSFNIREEADVSFIKCVLSSWSQWEQCVCAEKGHTAAPHTAA